MRRSAAERSNSTLKDRSSTDVSRGWCRVIGLTTMTLFLACAIVLRNGRILESFGIRQTEKERRAAAGRPPKTRKRRRTTASDLANGRKPPP